jgi:AraC-like DNA-binding protein
MLSFSTDDIAAADRFEHWREVRGKALFGVTMELPRERWPRFSGRFCAEEVGGATVSSMQASPYTIRRTNADIARAPGNSLSVTRQVSGLGVLDTGDDVISRVGDGDTIFSHSDMPFTAIPRREEAFDYRMLLIPLRDEIALDAKLDNMLATTSVRPSPFSRPIMALFNVLTSRGYRLDNPATAVTNIARLILLDRDRLKLGLSETRAALRSGLFHAAIQILSRDLHRPELSPARTAGELGVSLRQLHLLFEPSGRSFSQTLTDMRMAQACGLFETQPWLSITEIAHTCGMDSQATFYRAFRKMYGMTPGDKQALGRGRV